MIGVMSMNKMKSQNELRNFSKAPPGFTCGVSVFFEQQTVSRFF